MGENFDINFVEETFSSTKFSSKFSPIFGSEIFQVFFFIRIFVKISENVIFHNKIYSFLLLLLFVLFCFLFFVCLFVCLLFRFFWGGQVSLQIISIRQCILYFLFLTKTSFHPLQINVITDFYDDWIWITHCQVFNPLCAQKCRSSML